MLHVLGRPGDDSCTRKCRVGTILERSRSNRLSENHHGISQVVHRSVLYLRARHHFRFDFAPLGVDCPVPYSYECFERLTWLIPDETNWPDHMDSIIFGISPLQQSVL